MELYSNKIELTEKLLLENNFSRYRFLETVKKNLAFVTRLDLIQNFFKFSSQILNIFEDSNWL